MPFRSIVNHSQEAVLVLQNYKIKFANEAASLLLAFSIESLIGEDFAALLRADVADSVVGDIHLFSDNDDEEKVFEAVHIIDGAGIEKCLKMRLLSLSWQEQPALLVFLSEAPPLKKAKFTRQEQDAIFDSLVGRAYDGIAVVQNEQIVYLNDQMADILSYSVDEMIDTDISLYMHPDELPFVREQHNRKATTESSSRLYETKLIDKNGRSVDVQINFDFVPFRGRSASFLFVRNITERMQQQLIVNEMALALGQLTDLNEIYREIFVQVNEAMPVDLFIISFYDKDEKLIRAGYVHAYGKILDVSHLPDLPLAEDGKGVQSRVIRSGNPVYIADKTEIIDNLQTHHAIHEDGSVANNSVPVKDDEIAHSHLLVPMMIGGNPIGVMQIQYGEKNAYDQADIDLLSGLANMAAIAIQNARLLQRTQTQAQQVEQILGSVPDGVLLLDENMRLLNANQAAQNYLPYLTDVKLKEKVTHLGERPLSDFLEASEKGVWLEVAGGSYYFDVVIRPIKAKPGGWVMVIHDVTQEKEAQTRLQQQDRLAAVGQLAAGIAHDFNNIMTVISLYTDLIGRSDDYLSGTTSKRLDIIAKQSNRAADLIEQILDFSRRAVLERRPMDFLPFLKEVIKLLDRTLIENIQINFVHDEGDYIINADPTRMQQMIMNLAVNARDAMPHGGELNFELKSISFDSAGEDEKLELASGNWLQLIVADSGTGIETAVLPHVFDPFFTTKQPGEGSGLGLAQVWGIVKQHEGHITVHTEEDRGTTFLIFLPLFIQNEPTAPVGMVSDVTGGNKEMILVVEDNVMAQEVIVESLYALNYGVVTAFNGLEALEIMKNNGDEISLIISDVVMPEMGGISLLETLRDGGWKTAVLLLTGHPLNKELDDVLDQPGVEWLSKPVTFEQLADGINRCLKIETVDLS